MLIKSSYLVRMVDENRTNRVKLTIRFFNLKDGVIHTTDKTEIEVDDEVYIKVFYYNFFFKKKFLRRKKVNNFKNILQ